MDSGACESFSLEGVLDGTQRPLGPDYEPDIGDKKASGEQGTLL